METAGGPKIKLNNGLEMPMIAYGTYSRQLIEGVFYEGVCNAIKAGYRHIDTASIYQNEEEVGRAINDCMKEGIVKREELWITTKLWNDSHQYENVIPALKASLARMKLEYMDLYLVHWPVSIVDGNDLDIPHIETWKAMEEAVRENLTKAIGVSNFNERQLTQLHEQANIKPCVNQIEISLNLTQEHLVSVCQKLGVAAMAYTPLGLLSDARPEFAQHDYIKNSEILENISKRHEKTKAQIALRYLLDRNIAIAPKSFTKSRIEDNFGITQFKLSEAEILELNKLNKNFRLVDKFQGYNNYPF